MQKPISYLQQLHFDKKLWNTLQAKYVTNIRLVILLIISIIILGTFSFISIPRRLNPEIKIPIVIVSSVLPGAGPNDVEELLTTPLEDKLKDLKGIDTITSSSRENSSTIVIQFLSTVDQEKAKADVKDTVDTVTDLPVDTDTPKVTLLDFEDTPIWTFTISSSPNSSSNSGDTPSLMRFSRILEKKISALSKVDRVVLSGFDTQEIVVTIDQTKANEYGISPFVLSQLIQKSTNSYPAGNVKTEALTFSLTIDRDVTTLDDIRKLRLSSNGRSIAVSDIASISERSKPNQPYTFISSGTQTQSRAVEFFVYKSSNVNIDATEKEVKEVVEKTLADYDNQFELKTVMNTAEEITTQFSDLFGEFRSTIILVFILLLVFLGLRQAIISSLTVPLTFLTVFAVINALGLSLNFLTMFAFLIALGLLIDDTIVSVAAMTRYFRTGKFTAEETGLLVWRDFIVPLWSTTITTIWAFVPLLLATGIIGEFIKSIPIVVTATMLASTTIAVFITIPLMIIFLSPKFPKRVKVLLLSICALIFLGVVLSLIPPSPFFPLVFVVLLLLIFLSYRFRMVAYKNLHNFSKTNAYGAWFKKYGKRIDTGIIHIEPLASRYMVIIDRILQNRNARRNTLIAIIVFAFVGYLLLPLGFVKSEFFPKTDADILYVNVGLPAGTNLTYGREEMEKVLEKIRSYPESNFIVAEEGVRFDANGDRVTESGAFLLTLHLLKPEQRVKDSSEIAQDIRNQYSTYTKGTFSVQELSGGPPAGADIQIKLSGTDLGTLNRYAEKIAVFLRKQKGITNVELSVKPGTSKIEFIPDKQKMTDAGVSLDTLGGILRTFASGLTLDNLSVDGEDTDVIFRFKSEDPSPRELGSIMVPTTTGQQISLLSLGVLRLGNSPTTIAHEAGKRTISVAAAVTKGTTVADENKKLETYANSDLHLPDGYSWSTGGVNEENNKSVQSILQAMIISFILILVTMVIEFGSFRQALIALLIIPLAVSSVFYIFALTGTPLSFPALIGILALFGIVVTHAIVVIEKINDNRKHGMQLRNAIVDAAGNRLEPVLLTSLATIVGLIPITLADPLWRGLGGAIIAGLIFSGAIKLFFVPVMYYNWFGGEKGK